MHVDRRNSARTTGPCSRITRLLTECNIFSVLINYEISRKLYCLPCVGSVFCSEECRSAGKEGWKNSTLLIKWFKHCRRRVSLSTGLESITIEYVNITKAH